MFFSIGGLNPGNIITTVFISYRIVDGKSEIELSSEHIEISRKFKEEVVQPILKVKNNYRHLLHSWFVFCFCCFAKRVLVLILTVKLILCTILSSSILDETNFLAGLMRLSIFFHFLKVSY
jgi:hypothetical protein